MSWASPAWLPHAPPHAVAAAPSQERPSAARCATVGFVVVAALAAASRDRRRGRASRSTSAQLADKESAASVPAVAWRREVAAAGFGAACTCICGPCGRVGADEGMGVLDPDMPKGGVRYKKMPGSDVLCTDCMGQGVLKCPRCDGTALMPSIFKKTQLLDCVECDVTGYRICGRCFATGLPRWRREVYLRDKKFKKMTAKLVYLRPDQANRNLIQATMKEAIEDATPRLIADGSGQGYNGLSKLEKGALKFKVDKALRPPKSVTTKPTLAAEPAEPAV